MSKKLAELLVKDKLITPQMFEEAEAAGLGGRSYVRALIEKKYVSETKLLYYLSQKFGLPSINLEKFDIPPNIVKLVPVEMIKKIGAIPIQTNNQTLVVAMCDPTNLSELQNLKYQLKMNVEAVLTPYSGYDRALNKYFGGTASLGKAIESFKKEQKKSKDDTFALELVEVHDIDTNATAQDGPVISLVNGILSEAIRQGASDIHIEPYETSFRVRMRIDGVLNEVAQVPIDMKRPLVTRVKIMSRMDIGESRVPQDGRIKLRAGGREIDFRVSAMPTLFGEKMVLRILDKSAMDLNLERLGFEEKQLEIFRKGINNANGMVLVTGPTGSGKTTTLYSALSELNKVTDNISTVEDPVEYNLGGINQVQVHKDIGLTFASILRTFLRQDPDIVLVGEIRDFETAEVAVQAALTGHLVLSTLHTNDAPSTVARLMNMGIEPFLVTAAVNTIVAQRLIRKICVKCKQEIRVPKEQLLTLGFHKESVDRVKIFRGAGCIACGHSGYKGRMAIYEILDLNSELKEMILKGATALELKRQAIMQGMKPLRHAALSKVAEGTTTVEEAVSITMEH